MSGLDKMKVRILEDAKSTAAEITGKAREEAEAAVQAAKEAAEAEGAQITERAERSASDHIRKAGSSMDMQRRQALLGAKQAVIGEVLDEAYRAVMDLDDGSYFKLLEKLLEKHVLPGDGEICFSAEDLRRMPEGFEEKISCIAAAKGGSLKVSDRPAQMDGGFLLVYGGIEENCTIRAVFEAGREEMSDRVNRMLFG